MVYDMAAQPHRWMFRKAILALALCALTVPLLAEATFEASAIADAKGKVLITWTAPYEASNLGFNVYRDSAAGRVRLNKQIIAGSAFFTGMRELNSGRSYRWRDNIPDGAFAQYTIENLGLDGTRTMHGPVTPEIAGSVPDLLNTDTLATLGSRGGIFVSPRGIGAPRYEVVEPSRKQREKQYELASESSVKLMVTEEGWYRVAKSDLLAAGFNPGNKVALFAEGIEQSIAVTPTHIEFYGVGLDTPASGARAYWLTNEKGLGNRIRPDKSKGTRPVLTQTPFTFERIERTVFMFVNNGDREIFFGAVVGNWGTSQELAIESLDRSAGAASMELVLQGAIAGPHAVRLSLNGQTIGDVSFNDVERHVATISVPLASLTDGANTLALTALNGDLDISVVESLRLTYPHRLVASDDALKLTVAGGTSVTVSDLASTGVRAIDVTNAAEPIEVAVSLANGNASLVAPGSGLRSILVIGESRVLSPAQIVSSRDSTWNDRRNEADMVIIAARALAPAIEPLRVRRANEGISSVVVDVQDLYDEFGFGQRGPRAVRDFLARTREWKRAPKYVLFLGDASLDPRDYFGLGVADHVPTKLVPTFYMKTASDDWFADFDEDGVPELALGRLPARSLAEAETMVRHIVERDTDGNDGISFVTDFDPEYDFAGMAQALAGLTSASMPKTFANSATSANFESLLFTYIGHGSVAYWQAGPFFGSSAQQLTNAPKRPIVAAMTCLNGFFHDIFMSSMAEELLTNPNGGAVAVWASSTLTFPEPQMEMATEMFRQLFSGATAGEAAMRSKAATTDQDVRRSWIFFGDPSMSLR